MPDQSFKAAVVQWAPEVHDLEKGIKKACAAIAEAAKEGARLVVFPEVWLQGYLYWASEEVRSPAFQSCLGALQGQMATLDDPRLQAIFKTAKEHSINVVISLNEDGGGTIYATQLYISAEGELLGRHRKLMPTTVERLVWGQGEGDDPLAFDMDIGRVGGLLCFEHHMALARHACAQAGTQIHVSPWPGHEFLHGPVDACTRQLAMENGCYVLVAREVFDPAKNLSTAMDGAAINSGNVNGGSAIIAPGGEYIVGPVFDEETILYAEIDLARIGFAKWWFDPVGHYSRPDVFSLNWDQRKKPASHIKTD